ncbi:MULTISPECIES: helix-turn-helix transcriptional regulator [Paenibacillus]|uniref:Xre family transcriptional regulator n=1 Tax=Paenibacillus naphthalenovorans TaxID=162209 RepID=A0A0U2UA86_9BACL|nr:MULTISPECIES: helix-turn-helix transcriptional regulator [Paenibacillus]ALS23112.1 Xre family transcriptional regulator [Paenibacillus naphthalenovorans]NTZ17315.1 transcriptional regulator [Paenibacillus sp. JMULE4]GCL71826.1 transcriptional regulator [Paenibacillus naphthalenovorans]SDI39875.1 putative transcriptional regulator [Paenibacillus naphthalenovorans]
MQKNGRLYNKLNVLRAEKKWTQQDLAKKVGVSRQTIASIEANRYNPSLILAFEISFVFDKELQEVFQYELVEEKS